MQPRVCFVGHHHVRVDGEIDGVQCLGLNDVGWPRNLVAIEIEGGSRLRAVGRPKAVLAEWPQARR